MKIGLGRYRLRIMLKDRSEAIRADHESERELTDRELARLRHAEREYHETLWRPQSILAGPR
jgi:hypothetical protein